MFFLNECVLQDVRAEISGFLQQLRVEVRKKDFKTAALQSELHSKAQLGKPTQVANVEEELGLPALVFWCWARLTLLTLYHCFSSSACLAGDCQWDSVNLLLHYGCYFTECSLFYFSISISHYYVVKVQ